MLAKATITIPAFPLFPLLPAELRSQIWQDALPDQVRPALVPFKTGCWHTRGVEPELMLEFRHDLLEAATFEVSLAFVNHEARNVTVPWIHQQGLTIRPRKHKDPVFVRTFDPASDALYVEHGQLGAICSDFSNRSHAPDLLRRTVNVHSSVQRIAMSDLKVQFGLHAAPDLGIFMVNLEELLVVVNATSNLKPVKNRSRDVQPQWAFVRMQVEGATLYRNAEYDRLNLRGEREYVWDGATSEPVKSFEEVTTPFLTTYRRIHSCSLEGLPVFAVQR